MARISYVDKHDIESGREDLLTSSLPISEISEEYRHLMQRTERNSYRALGHMPDVLECYRNLVDVLKEKSGLTTFEQEVIILSGAKEINSKYEWHNHSRIALDSGIDEETIKDISQGNFDKFDDKYAILMRYVIDFMQGTVDDDLHDRISEYYDERTIVAIAVFIGYWLMNARVIHALDIEVEEPFIGWNLENL